MFWFLCLLALIALILAILSWRGKPVLWIAVAILAFIHLLPCLFRAIGQGMGVDH
jgi:hypothetical protein